MVRPMLVLVVCAASAAPNSLLHVDVLGLRNDHGAVYCELFRSAEGFPKKAEKAVAVVRAEIKDMSAVCEFRSVLPGAYAVAAYHDENGNGRVDTNSFGIPKEGVGASNDAKGSLGPPSFGRAKFVVDVEGKRIALRLHY